MAKSIVPRGCVLAEITLNSSRRTAEVRYSCSQDSRQFPSYQTKKLRGVTAVGLGTGSVQGDARIMLQLAPKKARCTRYSKAFIECALK